MPIQGATGMECVVRRVPMRHPGDASGVTTLIDDGVFAASDIVAILGKTEGNACVNDFTRGYALSALSIALAPRLAIAPEPVAARVARVLPAGTQVRRS